MSVKPQTSEFYLLRTSANRSRIRFANVNGSLFNNVLMHNSTEKIQITFFRFCIDTATSASLTSASP